LAQNNSDETYWICLATPVEVITIKPNLNNQMSLFASSQRGHSSETPTLGALKRGTQMARPKAPELTERELEIMQVFWDSGPQTANGVRDELAARGRDLAYTTVATLIRILSEKEFLQQTNSERPFVFKSVRSFEDVSGNIVNDLLKRVFRGSKEQMLVSLFGEQRLSRKDREALETLLREQD
jgi:BlaI family transcriptional regulator, penicillinase repressor